MGKESMISSDASDSLAVGRTEKSTIPFTAEELLVMGTKYAQARRLGMSWREDAAQEFALGGIDALKHSTAKDNIRAYQIKAGKWAVANLWRTLHRKKKHEDDYRRDRFGIVDRNSWLDPETLIDYNACDSLLHVIEEEERAIMRQAINNLPAQEREVLCASIYDNKRLRNIAQERNTSTSNIGRIYQQAVQLLKEGLGA